MTQGRSDDDIRADIDALMMRYGFEHLTAQDIEQREQARRDASSRLAADAPSLLARAEAAGAQVAQLEAENKRLRGDNDDFLRAICMILDARLGGRFTFTREALVSYPRNRELVIWDDPRTFTTVVETRLAATSGVAPDQPNGDKR